MDRESLIKLCEELVVRTNDDLGWWYLDEAGQAWALLKDDCSFTVKPSDRDGEIDVEIDCQYMGEVGRRTFTLPRSATGESKKPPPENEELIARCEKALVSQNNWSCYESSEAQLQLGELWALLRSGRKFYDAHMMAPVKPGHMWVEDATNGCDYYLPTDQALKAPNDWYQKEDDAHDDPRTDR